MKSNLANIFIRYLILVLVAIPNLFIFYLVFTPLTIYPVYFLLSFFFDVILIKNFMVINGQFQIELIQACIAGAAYYFLLIINLSTPKINLKNRITMIVVAFSSLLLLNITRIIFMTFVFNGYPNFFELTHSLLWYGLSTIFVVGIWFAEVKIFKIKEIPFYSDLKQLYRNSFLRR